ncbi:MAG: GTP cyclohydrolase FolE2 [Spirochaetota bacterium]
MVDVQSSPDDRRIPIKKVGVKNVRYPVTVLDKNYTAQNTVGTVNMFADLPHHYRGTHMSRFIEVFNRHYHRIQMPTFLDMLEEVRRSLEAETAYAEVTFPYFMEKRAPVSGQVSLMEYTCSYMGEVAVDRREFFVGVDAWVQTLCPCSREISARGAHNQRGLVKVRVKLGPFFWIEDLIQVIEGAASSGLYTLLKREDERYVTEHAYDHPVFVEDLVRDICLGIDEYKDFPWYSVEAENMESIHKHDAYAYAERGSTGAQGGRERA